MSCYTEKEIMERAIKILEEEGELTTTELKDLLNDDMNPTGEDLLINLNRKDTKFDQKVRNMISHRDSNELYKYFNYRREGREGILTSKAIRSKFIKLMKEDADTSQNVDKKQITERKEKKKTFRARRVDFNEINIRNKELGDAGEQFIVQYEKKRLSKVLADKVRHIAKEEGDGAGYDVLSYTTEGEVRFLEVKTTTGPCNTAFYMSENERLFLETYKEEAEIIRVYNFDMQKKTGEVYRIFGKQYLDEIKLQPIGYKVNFIDN